MNRAQKARYILIQDRVQRLELSFQGRYSRLSVSYRHILLLRAIDISFTSLSRLNSLQSFCPYISFRQTVCTLDIQFLRGFNK